MLRAVDYSVYGFPASPEDYVSSDEQRGRMREVMRRRGMEWTSVAFVSGTVNGACLRQQQYDGLATDAINERRYKVLEDQLAMYNQVKRQLEYALDVAHTILLGSFKLVDLLYKDIGFPGHGSRLTRNTLHDPAEGLLGEEAPSCGGRFGVLILLMSSTYINLSSTIIRKEIPQENQDSIHSQSGNCPIVLVACHAVYW